MVAARAIAPLSSFKAAADTVDTPRKARRIRRRPLSETGATTPPRSTRALERRTSTQRTQSTRPGTMTLTDFSDQAATHPVPQSQSLSRSYGSDLPTSLTYILLSTRGSGPWRPAAEMGTIRRDTSTWPSLGFSRFDGMIVTSPQVRCSSRAKPSLRARRFQGTWTLIQNR